MKADLHVHSCYSNGFFHPKELLSLATAQEINHLAIVDHHTFAGIEAVKEVFFESPVNLIEGIEISAFDLKRQKHVRILGYNLSNRSYIKQLSDRYFIFKPIKLYLS
ncbi:TPA: PHP domain-containing protein [Enterococcus faecium]